MSALVVWLRLVARCWGLLGEGLVGLHVLRGVVLLVGEVLVVRGLVVHGPALGRRRVVMALVLYNMRRGKPRRWQLLDLVQSSLLLFTFKNFLV